MKFSKRKPELMSGENGRIQVKQKWKKLARKIHQQILIPRFS